MEISKEKTKLLYEYDKPIIWNLSSFGNEYQMGFIDGILDILSKYNLKNPIATLHGSYSCKYNGGRSAIFFNSPSGIKDKIKHFNDLGIGIKLTFSNPEIHKNTINEEEMRWYLDILSEVPGIGNGIICVNDDFAEEVKKQYPNLELVGSHVKMEAETKMGITDDINYYNSKFDLYDIVVMNAYRAFDDDFLSKITHPEKIEFIVNHVCSTNCPYAKYHHSLIDQMQKNKLKNFNNIELIKEDPEAQEIKRKIDDVLLKCKELKENLNDDKIIKQNINREEINYLNNVFNINRFKIEGRDLPMEFFIRSLYKYLLNDESIIGLLAKGNTLNKEIVSKYKSRLVY